MSTPNEEWKHFGDALAAFVKRRDIGLTRLSKQSGVNYDTLKRWNGGETKNPQKWEEIVSVAAALSLNATDTNLLLRLAGHPSIEKCQLPDSNEQVKQAINDILRSTSPPTQNSLSEPVSLPLAPDFTVIEVIAKETLARIQSIDVLQQHQNTELVEVRRATKRLLSLKVSTPDAVSLETANRKLDELPLDSIPNIAALPIGSCMPFSANPLFVGRESELKAIAVALKGGETVAIGQIAAATGLGGIGKTQLAVEFVHRYGQFFSGGVHWLSFTDPNGIATKIAECGVTMPDLRADFDTFDFEDQVQLVLSAWQSPLPRLLIFDNCEEPLLLEQWRPKTGGSRVLVTSRRQQWDMTLNVQSLVLETLTRAQSIELLRNFRPDLAETDPILEQIAAEVGDLPLALHLAGNYLARYRYEIKPEQYLAQLRQPALLQHRSLQQGDLSPTGHEQHVVRTFALSYKQLAADAFTLYLLAQIACFAPGELIPRDLLRLTAMKYEESNDTLDTALQLGNALHRLTELGLIQVEKSGQIVIHRLLALFIKYHDQESYAVAEDVVEATLLGEASRINDTDTVKTLLVWQVHLRHRTDLAKLRLDETAAGLCNTLGVHLRLVGELVTAKPYSTRALAISEKVLGEKHRNTLICLNNLGVLLRDMGELAEAKSYLERALAISEEVLGEKHSDTAYCLTTLGISLKDTEYLAEAKSYLERALAINEEVLGEKHPETAITLTNLGVFLRERGDLPEARYYLERALAINEEVLGEKHPETAAMLNNLGGVLRDMGELTEARSYFERALAINEEMLGEQHPNTALILGGLGALLRDMGELTEARSYFERALAINEEMLGEQHPNTALSLSNLGALLREVGESEMAKLYCERAVAIYEGIDVLGKRHHHIALSLNNLGLLLVDAGNLAEAKPYLERALAINEEVLGEKHRDVALGLNNFGMLLRGMGKLAEAKPYLERALAIFEEVLGEKHLDSVGILTNLGILLEDMGELSEAELYFKRVTIIRLEVLGLEHLDTATSLIDLGVFLQNIGKLAEAKSCLVNAWRIRNEILGSSHPLTEEIYRSAIQVSIQLFLSQQIETLRRMGWRLHHYLFGRFQ